jgi:hypothetical protein
MVLDDEATGNWENSGLGDGVAQEYVCRAEHGQASVRIEGFKAKILTWSVLSVKPVFWRDADTSGGCI